MAAASAAKPGSKVVDEMYNDASESIAVASHVRHWPFCHGTNVRPSGHFPSSLSNPVDSLVARTSICWSQVNLLALFLHDRPWVPLVLTNASYGQLCALQWLRPRHKLMVTWIVSSHMSKPQEEMKCKESVNYCGLLWALKVSLCPDLQLLQIVVQSLMMPEASHDHCQAEHLSSSMEGCWWNTNGLEFHGPCYYYYFFLAPASTKPAG